MRGAAMLEFAVAAPIILLMFTLVIDGGFLMYRYLRLRHITAQVAREMATTAAAQLVAQQPRSCPGAQCCATVREFACAARSRIYTADTDALQKGISFYVEQINPNPWKGIPLIRVRGELAPLCMFCRIFAFTSSGFTLKAISVVGFEWDGTEINCPSLAANGPC
ncbi:MAG: pilus assembly protein [Proteobacteria bacterium]|nr:pilus assembly protein [Pseudomonadota bacterium]